MADGFGLFSKHVLRAFRESLRLAESDRALAESGMHFYYAVDYFLLYGLAHGLSGNPGFPLWPAVDSLFDRLGGQLLFLPPSIEEMNQSYSEQVTRAFVLPEREQMDRLRADPNMRTFLDAYREFQQRAGPWFACLAPFQNLCHDHRATLSPLLKTMSSDDLFTTPAARIRNWILDESLFIHLPKFQRDNQLTQTDLGPSYAAVLVDLDARRAGRRSTNPTDAGLYAMCEWLSGQLGARRRLVLNLTDGYLKRILGMHPVDVGGTLRVLVRDISTQLMRLSLADATSAPSHLALPELLRLTDTLLSMLDAAKLDLRGAEDIVTQLEHAVREGVFVPAYAGKEVSWNWGFFTADFSPDVHDDEIPFDGIWSRMKVAFAALSKLEEEDQAGWTVFAAEKKQEVVRFMGEVYSAITDYANYRTSWDSVKNELEGSRRRFEDELRELRLAECSPGANAIQLVVKLLTEGKTTKEILAVVKEYWQSMLPKAQEKLLRELSRLETHAGEARHHEQATILRDVSLSLSGGRD